MILFIDSKGNQVKTIAETIYQGSNLANQLVVVAPLSQSLSAYLTCKLPNGYLTETMALTQYNDILSAEYSGMSAWQILIPIALTKYYGQVQYQVRFLNAQGQIVASCSSSFQVARGIAPSLPTVSEENPQTAYEQVLQHIAEIEADMVNGFMESKGLLPYDNTFTYQSGTLVFTNVDGLISIHRSKVADNKNNSLSDTDSWQNLGQIATRDYVDSVVQTIITQTDLNNAIATHNNDSDAHSSIRNSITTKISQHNTDSSAHTYIQNRITVLDNSKASATSVYNDSTSKTYSTRYSNNHFAPISYVNDLYATKDTSLTRTAYFTNEKPTNSPSNIMTESNTTNTDYNWSSPDFTFIRTIYQTTKIGNNNSFTLSLAFQVDRDCTLSFGGKIKYSTDNGSNWTYISSSQPTSSQSWSTGVGNTVEITLTSDLADNVVLARNSLLAFEIFKKQEDSTALTTDIYCGVEVDGADINTTLHYNFANVYLNTDQIANGAVTYPKLSDDLKSRMSQIYQNITYREAKTITSWSSASGVEPYTYTTSITLSSTIGTNTIVELVNNNASAFATYGFAILSITGQSLVVGALSEPQTSIDLTFLIYETTEVVPSSTLEAPTISLSGHTITISGDYPLGTSFNIFVSRGGVSEYSATSYSSTINLDDITMYNMVYGGEYVISVQAESGGQVSALSTSVTFTREAGTYTYDSQTQSLTLVESWADLLQGSYVAEANDELTNVNFSSSVEILVIPENITSIESATSPYIESIYIPYSVATISANAFESSGMSECHIETINSQLQSIGTYAFYGCSNLTDIPNLPNITAIPNYAFMDCTSITSIYLPEITSIGTSAFDGCSNVTILTIDDVETISYGAFADCSSLGEVYIGGTSLTSIGSNAFSGCSSLGDLYYAGTSEQWSLIQKGSDWDDGTDITYIYEYSPFGEEGLGGE